MSAAPHSFITFLFSHTLYLYINTLTLLRFRFSSAPRCDDTVITCAALQTASTYLCLAALGCPRSERVHRLMSWRTRCRWPDWRTNCTRRRCAGTRSEFLSCVNNNQQTVNLSTQDNSSTTGQSKLFFMTAVRISSCSDVLVMSSNVLLYPPLHIMKNHLFIISWKTANTKTANQNMTVLGSDLQCWDVELPWKPEVLLMVWLANHPLTNNLIFFSFYSIINISSSQLICTVAWQSTHSPNPSRRT